MASTRLIFDHASIGSTANSSTNIYKIVTESITMSEEALQVAIEDNQNFNEGFTTTLSFRTLSKFAEDGTTPVADPDNSASLTYCGNVSPLTKKTVTMHGVNGSNTYAISSVYVMGRRVYENGREEYEVSCQFDSTKLSIVKS